MTSERFRQLSPATRVALVLIALGLILLLLRLSIFSSASLVVLSRFWPLLLVGFGLDLLGRRPHPSLSYGMLSVFLLLALMLLGPALGLGGRLRAESLNVPLAGTRSADIELDLSAAPATVSVLTDSPDLLRADITDRGRVILNTRGNDDKTVRLAERRRFFGFGSEGRRSEGGRWQVGLSPTVLLELSVDSGSGPTDLDLEGLQLTDLELESGSGSTEAVLPASRDRYDVAWDGGSGATRLSVTDGAAFDFEGDGGSGALELTFGGDVAAELELDGGSGPMTFTLPANTEARFEVEDSGSGALQLSERFRRVSGDEDDDEGAWETTGFAGAERAIIIRIQDSGSGSITVQ